jgi:murein DD-endopeptidase MepM/ murein hydrolase activator NlpD
VKVRELNNCHCAAAPGPNWWKVFLLTTLFLSLSSCSLFGPPRSTRETTYQVQPGDTLAKIAIRNGLLIEDLIRANELEDPDRLEVGQILKIPAHSRRTIRPDLSSERQVKLNAAKKYIGKLEWPVANAPIGSFFGDRNGNFHEGIDLPARTGTPIYAAHDGKVAYAGKGLRGYGYMVVIDGGAISTIYAHNSKNLVRRGDAIDAGDKIALVGATGRATGPHLHYEIRIRDQDRRLVAVDPLTFYPQLHQEGD